MKTFVAALAFLSMLCLAMFQPAAFSAGVNTNMTVSVVVDNACQISTTNVAFPVYAPLGANATTPDDSTAGSVTITCTTGTSGHITVGQGSNWTGSQARMFNGTGNTYLPYTISQDSSHSVVWDSITGMAIPAAPDGTPRVYTVYGRIPAGQNVTGGTYTDTVVVSMLF